MSLVEHEPYSSTSRVVETERAHPEQSKILSFRVMPFLEHIEHFREVFQSGPDATFSAYNPSSAFINHPDSYRAVRVDCSDGTTNRTKSIIFKDTDDGLKPHTERHFDLEDPFVTNFNDEIVFGGVQVDKSHGRRGQTVSNWRTVLFRGKTIPKLRPFFTGPEGMKDIRLIEKPDGKIGVYTRPRNPRSESLGGKGQIGYTEFESLDHIENSDPSSLDIHNAPLLSSFRFPQGQWGGVNHVQTVPDGRYQGWNLALTHRAYRDTVRHYSSDALLHDPTTGRIVDLGTLVKRSDLPPGPWKGQERSRELQDVFFGTELTLIDKYRARIIGGMSDEETGEAEIANPLLQLTT